MASGRACFSPSAGAWGRRTPLLRAVPAATVQNGHVFVCEHVVCVRESEREGNVRDFSVKFLLNFDSVNKCMSSVRHFDFYF